MFGLSYLGKFAFGIGSAVVDRTTSMIFGKRICLAKHVGRRVTQCHPWTNHLYPSAIDGVNSAITNGDWKVARTLIDIGKTEEADPNCIRFLLGAVNLLAQGHEIEVGVFEYLGDFGDDEL